jgi:hypothetical protein
MFSLERRRRVRLSLAGPVVLAIAFSCAAQSSRVAGAIQGSVVDQTGGTVANATVTLRNQGTNRTRTISTNAEGSFRAGELPVGPYEVRVESPGFSPYFNNAIAVSIGRAVQITVRLTPATVQQQITVSEQPPSIDPTQTTEATTIDRDRIEESPVLPSEFQPIIAYLFTEWKCNLDCHYCWSYDNRVKGVTEDTARRAIDWLESTPCRVLAPTGGEPLIRPDFVH